MYYDWGWPPRVNVAQQRLAARLEKARLEKTGRKLSPVSIEGRAIARTFWGTAWCENLERYSDYETRLPRGRSYVRNGLVLHLEIGVGSVEALVRGTALYDVNVGIKPLRKAHWKAICRDSTGAVDSLVALVQGRFSKGLMERFCQQEGGLFPSPREITFSCSCPDWASMCKHVAAVLYGVGARLDERPELLFRLRRVDAEDLIAEAASGAPLAGRNVPTGKILAGANLSQLFGLHIGGPGPRVTALGAGDHASRARTPKKKRKGRKPNRAKKSTAKRAGR
jgi:uncharacterized Zn finger protein